MMIHLQVIDQEQRTTITVETVGGTDLAQDGYSVDGIQDLPTIIIITHLHTAVHLTADHLTVDHLTVDLQEAAGQVAAAVAVLAVAVLAVNPQRVVLEDQKSDKNLLY